MSSVARLPVRATALVAALGLALALTSGPAAAANDWGTYDRIDGARLQACKVPVGAGRAWRIELRVRTTDEPAHGSMTVINGQGPTDRRWHSGRVARHDTSAVGSVRLHRGPRWSLRSNLETPHAGSTLFGGGARGLTRC